MTSVSGARSDDDRLLDMIGLLEKQLAVGADDSSITISVEWPNRDLAFEIIDFLQKHFLEASYDANVNVIREAIRILEERAKPAAEVRCSARRPHPDRGATPGRPSGRATLPAAAHRAPPPRRGRPPLPRPATPVTTRRSSRRSVAASGR